MMNTLLNCTLFTQYLPIPRKTDCIDGAEFNLKSAKCRFKCYMETLPLFQDLFWLILEKGSTTISFECLLALEKEFLLKLVQFIWPY